MKKLSYLLVAAIILLFPFVASAKDKVNVYIFRGEGCPHCEEALEFFDNLSNDDEYKDLYKLVTYEVWYDENNSKLMSDVADALGDQVSGVPYIVIGTKTFAGYAAAYDDKIKDAIKTAYEDDEYKDVVKQVKGGKYTPEKYKFPIVPVAIVAGVVVLAVIGMVIFTSEKDDEVEVKEVKKEVVKEEPKKEEKKATPKKTTSKKAPAKKTTKKTNKK
ncbi:MAG: hypothetical protein IKZ96_01670 [Bacilli bacterium]|nr:hypothetical protein [Bacilli bacterium]